MAVMLGWMRSSAFKNEEEFQNIELLGICAAVLKFISAHTWELSIWNLQHIIAGPSVLATCSMDCQVPRNLLETYLSHPPYWCLLYSIFSESCLGWSAMPMTRCWWIDILNELPTGRKGRQLLLQEYSRLAVQLHTSHFMQQCIPADFFVSCGILFSLQWNRSFW